MLNWTDTVREEYVRVQTVPSTTQVRTRGGGGCHITMLVSVWVVCVFRVHTIAPTAPARSVFSYQLLLLHFTVYLFSSFFLCCAHVPVLPDGSCVDCVYSSTGTHSRYECMHINQKHSSDSTYTVSNSVSIYR